MNQTAEIINFERPVVKADLGNGYDRLAHDITDSLALNIAKLSGCEYQIIFAIVGKTYRFHKKLDWIANSQLCDKTGMSKNHVSKTMKSLISKNIIVRNGKTIGLNNIVSEWGSAQLSSKVNQSVNNDKLTNQCTKVNQSVYAVNQLGIKSTPITPPHKKETNTKETNTKETIYSTLPKNGIFSPNQSTKIPEHFPVTNEMKSWALENKITVDLETETTQFVDHFISKGETREDWFAAWRMWMRNSKKFNSGSNYKNKSQPENFAKKDYGQSTFTGGQ
jgi:phage replication O-like protein O